MRITSQAIEISIDDDDNTRHNAHGDKLKREKKIKDNTFVV